MSVSGAWGAARRGNQSGSVFGYLWVSDRRAPRLPISPHSPVHATSFVGEVEAALTQSSVVLIY